MNLLWKKKQGAKIRLAVSHSKSIRKAVENSIDAKEVVTKFFESFNTAPISTAEARNWVYLNMKTDTTSLYAALTKLYADSFVLGQDISLSALAKANINKAPTLRQLQRAMDTDWNSWKPGNRAAARLLKPSGALQKLLRDRGLVIDGISKTTYDRIGTQLAYALQRGLSPSSTVTGIMELLPVPSKERAAYLVELGYKEVDAVLYDPQRALTIAQTEMSRAVGVASREMYEESGVELVEWLTADPCDECQENSDVSPIGIGETFPSGDTEPPVHPNCVCDIGPYVLDTRGLGDEALSLLLDE